jgi:hypothetical protein
MEKIIKRAIIPMLAVLFIGTIIGSLNQQSASADDNVEVESSSIRVVVGQRTAMSLWDADRYTASREAYVCKLSADAPDGFTPSLLSLNEYMTADDFQSQIFGVCSSERLTINEVYVWVPGKTGRSIIPVKNNDVKGSIADFIASLNYEESEDVVFKSDIAELETSGMVFAAVVTTDNRTLEAVALSDEIFVDPLKNEKAEELAFTKGKSISYICVPDKPDGTH